MKMAFDMKNVMIYCPLTLMTMVAFPCLCWIEVLAGAVTHCYRCVHKVSDGTAENMASVTKVGVLTVGIVVALNFMPAFRYFITIVATLLFTLTKDRSRFGDVCISVSASVALWILSYVSFEMTCFSFGGVFIYTFLKAKDKSLMKASGQDETNIPGNNLRISEDTVFTMNKYDPNTAGTVDGGLENITAIPDRPISVHDNSGGSHTSGSHSNPKRSAGVDGGDVNDSNVAGTVHGGMGNITEIKDSNLRGNTEGSSTSESQSNPNESVGVVGGEVKNANVAGTVHGGMGNITEIKDSNLCGNTEGTSTSESQSNPNESVGVVGGEVKNANVAGTVYGGVGNITKIKDSNLCGNTEGTSTSEPQSNPATDAGVAGGGHYVNIEMKDVRIGEEKPYKKRPPEVSDDSGADGDEDAGSVLLDDGVQGEMEEHFGETNLGDSSMDENKSTQQTEMQSGDDTSADEEEESKIAVDKDTLKSVQDTVKEIRDKINKDKPQDQQDLVYDPTQVQRDIEAKEKRIKYGRTPLMMAARAGNKTFFFHLIDKQDSDLAKQDKKSNNILHIACLGGNTEIVRYILDEGINVDSIGQYGRTPAMLAAQKGSNEVFKVLVEYGCNLYAEDANGNTVLHMACIGGNVDIVKYLIEEQKYKVNTKGQYGRTPAMLAADKGNEEVFCYLLENHCDLTILDQDGGSCYFYAKRGGNANILSYLESVQSI